MFTLLVLSLWYWSCRGQHMEAIFSRLLLLSKPHEQHTLVSGHPSLTYRGKCCWPCYLPCYSQNLGKSPTSAPCLGPFFSSNSTVSDSQWPRWVAQGSHLVPLEPLPCGSLCPYHTSDRWLHWMPGFLRWLSACLCHIVWSTALGWSVGFALWLSHWKAALDILVKWICTLQRFIYHSSLHILGGIPPVCSQELGRTLLHHHPQNTKWLVFMLLPGNYFPLLYDFFLQLISIIIPIGLYVFLMDFFLSLET